jgi:hypothetical protein
LYPSLENSTTGIAITCGDYLGKIEMLCFNLKYTRNQDLQS